MNRKKDESQARQKSISVFVDKEILFFFGDEYIVRRLLLALFLFKNIKTKSVMFTIRLWVRVGVCDGYKILVFLLQ